MAKEEREEKAPEEMKAGEYNRRKEATVVLTSERTLRGERPYLFEASESARERRGWRRGNSPPEHLGQIPVAPSPTLTLAVDEFLPIPDTHRPFFSRMVE